MNTSGVEHGDWLEDGPDDAAWVLVLAHGAGQGMDSAFMAAFAEGLAGAPEVEGGLRVVRFEFPYMVRARRSGKRAAPDRQPVLENAWGGVVARLAERGYPPRRLVVGGKSLGGRIASLVADGCSVAGLVCLGYPFHPPGRPERLRTAHLANLATPALVCQGTRDPFGTREEVDTYALSPTIGLHWVEDGDHSFKPRRSSGRSEAQNLEEARAAVARFIAGLSRQG